MFLGYALHIRVKIILYVSTQTSGSVRIILVAHPWVEALQQPTSASSTSRQAVVEDKERLQQFNVWQTADINAQIIVLLYDSRSNSTTKNLSRWPSVWYDKALVLASYSFIWGLWPGKSGDRSNSPQLGERLAVNTEELSATGTAGSAQ